MRIIRNISSALVGMAAAGLAFPQMAAIADSTPAVAPAPAATAVSNSHHLSKSAAGEHLRASVRDVRLDAHGRLNGKLWFANGPAAGQQVVIQTLRGKPVARALSDADGSFTASGLRPGLYRVVWRHSAAVYRVWDHAAAPPAAAQHVELHPMIVRAQNAPPDVLFDQNGNPYGRVRVSDAPPPTQPVPETGGVIYEPAPAAFAGPDIFTLATLGAAVTGAVLGGVALHEAQKGGPASP